MQCPLMRRAIAPRLAAAIAAGLLCSVSVSAAQAPEPPAPLVADRIALTIDDAIRRAIDLSPSLRASAEGVSAAEGAWRQAGARPNPQLLIEAENFAGSGEFNGVSSSEFSYSLAQQIERGGKRRARRAVAGADREIADLNVQRTNLDIAFAAQTAFIEAVTAKAAADLARDRAAGFEETRRAVARRVEVAKDPRGAGDSAAAAAAEARSDLARADRESVIAREQLAILTGLDAAQMMLVAPWFTAPPDGAVGGRRSRLPLTWRFSNRSKRARTPMSRLSVRQRNRIRRLRSASAICASRATRRRFSRCRCRSRFSTATRARLRARKRNGARPPTSVRPPRSTSRAPSSPRAAFLTPRPPKRTVRSCARYRRRSD